MTDRISGGAFKQMVAFGAACITAQKQAINDLNVFPVPDGDTGTNMSLTIQTAVTELRRVEPSTLEEAAKITASGLLRGARGNSGVILSLLFRGMSKVFKGLAEADGAQLAAAMQEGVTTGPAHTRRNSARPPPPAPAGRPDGCSSSARPPTSRWTVCAPIWAASATVW